MDGQISSSAEQKPPAEPVEPFKERIELYRKAGVPTRAILEKIESEFGLEARYEAEELLHVKYESKREMSKMAVMVLVVLIAIFIFIVSYFTVMSLFDSPSFTATKCSLIGPITVTGDPDFKLKIQNALLLVEGKNCNYLRFISDNFPEIYSGNTAVTGASFYDPLKHSMAPDYSGSNFFVADAIIHQACHGYQVRSHQPQNEHDCALTQYDFLESIGAPDSDLQRVLDLRSNPDYFFDSNNVDVFSEWLGKN